MPLVALSFLFLVDYGREVYPLWRMVAPWTFFLSQPYVGTEQYFGEDHAQLSLLLVADGHGEGTRVVYYFPSWPLALAAAGVLVYAFLTVFGQNEKSETNPAAPGNGAITSLCHVARSGRAVPEQHRYLERPESYALRKEWHKREATVHLTSCVAGKSGVIRRPIFL